MISCKTWQLSNSNKKIVIMFYGLLLFLAAIIVILIKIEQSASYRYCKYL